MTGAYLMTPAQKRDIPHLLWTATSWDCNLLWTPHMLNNFTIFTRFCPPKDCSKRVTDALETGLSSTVSTADMSRSHVWLLPIARLCTFKLNCNYNSYRNLMAYQDLIYFFFLVGGKYVQYTFLLQGMQNARLIFKIATLLGQSLDPCQGGGVGH